jgi:hypothetical protein
LLIIISLKFIVITAANTLTIVSERRTKASDRAAQSFVANVYIVLRWVDPRLAHDQAGGVVSHALSEVWAPRCLLANEIGLVRQTLPAIVEADPSGQVTYRQRYVGPFSQPLLLKDFPFDQHVFRLQLASPGYTPEQIAFVADEHLISQGLDRAAGIASDISLPDWKAALSQFAIKFEGRFEP